MIRHFQKQIDSGAKENFFYGTEQQNGEIRIERHRGPIETLSLEGYTFTRMMGSTPFFRPTLNRQDLKEVKSQLGYSRVGLWGK